MVFADGGGGFSIMFRLLSAGFILIMRKSLGFCVLLGVVGVGVVVILSEVNSMPGVTDFHSGKEGREELIVESVWLFVTV